MPCFATLLLRTFRQGEKGVRQIRSLAMRMGGSWAPSQWVFWIPGLPVDVQKNTISVDCTFNMKLNIKSFATEIIGIADELNEPLRSIFQPHWGLVGGLVAIFWIFPYQLGISSSQLTSSNIFQRGWNQPPTTAGLLGAIRFFVRGAVPPIFSSKNPKKNKKAKII